MDALELALEERDEAKAALAEIEKMRCLFCAAVAPENEKDWPDTECVVCVLGAELPRAQAMVERLKRALVCVRDAFEEACGCKNHSSEECCNAVGDFCMFCVAAGALDEAKRRF